MPAAMTALATVTLGSVASTVTFGSIPATYRDLRLVIQGSYNIADTAFFIKLNSDATSGNYTSVAMQGNGSSTASWNPGYEVGWYAYPTANALGDATIDILDYSATDKHKSMLTRNNAANANVRTIATRWANTAAVTSVTFALPAYLSPSFNAGTTLSLYGISA